jgi:hypothetical protein
MREGNGLEENASNEIRNMPLLYLLYLQTVVLPKVVTRPEDVQYGSVLKATGLVDADIAPAADGGGKYSVARTATVTRITEDGMAEIAKLLLTPRRTPRTQQMTRDRMRSIPSSA